jgi:hypothetical protein
LSSRDDDSDDPYEVSVVDDEDDDSLPSSVVTTDPDTESDEMYDEGMYQKSLNDYHREAFYRAYTPYFDQVQDATHLISQQKYDHILAILTNPREKREPAVNYKYRKQYSVGSNVAGVSLYREGKVVTTFEKVFDVIQEAHRKISHAMDPQKNKRVINDDLGYFGVPASVIDFFIKTCPIVSIMVDSLRFVVI